MSKQSQVRWLALALTMILVGYFLPWLSHPTSGLTLIGLDISEWMKFMPQMRSGELPNRDIFYLPPITLGGILALLSFSGQDRSKWRPWLLRCLAIVVALIAFPSIDAIRFEPVGEWRPRILLIGLVILLAIIGSVWGGRLPSWSIAALIATTALVGLVLPTYIFMIVMPVAESWLVLDFQIGSGVFLNGFGHLWVCLYMAWWGWQSSQSI